MTTFSKSERISSQKEIDLLFEQGTSFLVYPLRIVLLSIPKPLDTAVPVSILVSVPKRKFKRAVHRNRIKRLIREAYRTNKQGLQQKSGDERLLVAFLYLSDTILPYQKIEDAMKKALCQLGHT